MKKLLYVGHYLHLKTKSTVFLVDIFRRHYEVTELPINPEEIDVNSLNCDNNDFDVVVIFQLDFLAPIFIAKDMPTVVVPMFDGSENMPPRHWEFSNQARFLSFSLSLHLKILRAGGKSLLVKYFPEIPPSSQIRSFEKPSGFFWERRPDTGINVSLIHRLVGDTLNSLHLHLSPDIPSLQSSNAKGVFRETKVSVSKWFEDKRDLEKVMSNSNIYFAPRLSEGIGMGFLEAMAAGMVVVAHDSSTHNEYISNWDNGILYSMGIQSLPPFHTSQLQQIGDAARQTILEGRRIWETQIPEIIEWVEYTPKPNGAGASSESLAFEIPQAYCSGFNSYLNFLGRNLTLIRQLSPGLEHLRDINAPYVDLESYKQPSNINALQGNFIRLGSSGTRNYLGKGWSHDEEKFVWIDGNSGHIHFLADSANTNSVGLNVVCHSLPFEKPQKIAVTVNESLCDTITVVDRIESFYIPLPPGKLGQKNHISFFAEQTGSPNGETRKLSLAVHSIEFDC